jgi:hypothetical protein
MGTSSILDIIGSFVIAGFLFLMTMRMNATAQETSAVYRMQLDLQTNLTTLISILENDLEKIGYCKDFSRIPDPSKAVLLADSTRIKFLGDYNHDGNLDSIYYYLGPTTELTDTPNLMDRYLYKQSNAGTPEKWNFGTTRFAFKYFDAEGDSLAFPIIFPSLVASMEISVQIEAPDPYVGVLSKEEEEGDRKSYMYETFWRQIRLVSQNLKNR